MSSTLRRNHLVRFEQRQNEARVLQVRPRRTSSNRFEFVFLANGGVGRNRSCYVIHVRSPYSCLGQPPSHFGKTVAMPKVIPAKIKSRVTVMPAALAHFPFTYSPITSRSFTRSRRNASAGGIARTAITLTVRTTNSSGNLGIKTSTAAVQAEPSRVR